MYDPASQTEVEPDRWSIMRAGIGPSIRSYYPLNSTYRYELRFSIEELLTVETDSAVDEAH